jgi:hypothetical protein
MIKLKSLLEQEEVKVDNKEFIEFCKKRLEGAKKIVDNAKEKGGPALLTYNHFVVKLPYYQNAVDGMFDCKMAETEYTNYLNTLCGITEADGFEQIEFQKLVGLIEVLGELIIKYKQNK